MDAFNAWLQHSCTARFGAISAEDFERSAEHRESMERRKQRGGELWWKDEMRRIAEQREEPRQPPSTPVFAPDQNWYPLVISEKGSAGVDAGYVMQGFAVSDRLIDEVTGAVRCAARTIGEVGGGAGGGAGADCQLLMHQAMQLMHQAGARERTCIPACSQEEKEQLDQEIAALAPQIARN